MSRVALVTGGTRGIGEAISKALKAAGRTVVATYAHNDDAAAKFAAETGVKPYRFDVANFDDCRAAVEKIHAEVGKIEILVNNAGITRDATIGRQTRENWDAVIDTDLGSVFNMCKLVFDEMRAGKFGRIVNISSINGQAGQLGQVNYSAAKAGMLGFTKALAQEGARYGITVNALAPGYVDTEMVRAVPPDVLEKIVARIPVGRLGRGEDIARGVLFLTADDAARLKLLQRAAHIAMTTEAIIPIEFQATTWAARAGITIVPRTDERTFAASFRPKS